MQKEHVQAITLTAALSWLELSETEVREWGILKVQNPTQMLQALTSKLSLTKSSMQYKQ